MILFVLLIAGLRADAQFLEYRITDDGQYQYLGNREMAGLAFDETQGAYYKAITARTFFLQVHERGVVSADVTYEDFILLSLDEQRALLVQSPIKPLDCSIGQVISEGCLVYRYNPSQGANKMRNASVKRLPIEKNESIKIILNEE